jgi:hypothetical protein
MSRKHAKRAAFYYDQRRFRAALRDLRNASPKEKEAWQRMAGWGLPAGVIFTRTVSREEFAAMFEPRDGDVDCRPYLLTSDIVPRPWERWS